MAGCSLGKNKNPNVNPEVNSTPKPRVNLIEFKDRPYVSLQPLAERNVLEFKINNLPLKAKNVEVLLEYDRNKGVLDAVLKNFNLAKIPYIDNIFLGSKSAGGHITYHEDVIGGKLTLTFGGEKESYALEVPWRYDDTQPYYTELSSTDSRFQVTLDKPWKTSKILIMQSPGLPVPLANKIILGPYLIRGVGPIPNNTASIKINLPEEIKAKLMYFNGQKWIEAESNVNGKILQASGPLAEAYVIVE